MTAIPRGCTCYYTEQRDPYEPQLGSWLDGEPDQLCPVHFPPPTWLPRPLHAAWLRWRAARLDPERGELWQASTGAYAARHVDVSLWLSPLRWGLGVDYEDDWHRYTYTGEGGRVWVSATLGPLCLSAALCQPYVEPPKPPRRAEVPLSA